MIDFTGEGSDESGFLIAIDETIFIKEIGKKYLLKIKERLAAPNTPLIAFDPAYLRPTEVELLIGDATKARSLLGWTPEYDLKGLISDMLKSDIHLMKKDCYLKKGGYSILNYFEG